MRKGLLLPNSSLDGRVKNNVSVSPSWYATPLVIANKKIMINGMPPKGKPIPNKKEEYPYAGYDDLSLAFTEFDGEHEKKEFINWIHTEVLNFHFVHEFQDGAKVFFLWSNVT